MSNKKTKSTPNLIGVSGRMGVGKDTAAGIIMDLIPDYENKKFAGKLKLTASILLGIPVERFEDQDFKELKMDPEWDYSMVDGELFGIDELKEICDVEGVEWNEHYRMEMTYRNFIQYLGTNAMRDGLHPDVWVNALFSEYYEELCDWVISDVRFPNECKAIKERGGIIIRIERGSPKAVEHISETVLDKYEGFDYIVENNGTVADLKTQLIDILVKEKLM